MESMSRPTLRLALGGLVVCAIGGFWLGLQGALPRDGAGSASAEAASTTLETAPSATLTATEVAPYSDIPIASDEPAASEAPAASDEPEPAPKQAPPPTTPRPEPTPKLEAPAPSAAPATPAPTPAPASATPPPEEDLPPY
jgi:hypothetical protein